MKKPPRGAALPRSRSAFRVAPRVLDSARGHHLGWGIASGRSDGKGSRAADEAWVFAADTEGTSASVVERAGT